MNHIKGSLWPRIDVGDPMSNDIRYSISTIEFNYGSLFQVKYLD